jgi:hypothetical protein
MPTLVMLSCSSGIAAFKRPFSYSLSSPIGRIFSIPFGYTDDISNSSTPTNTNKETDAPPT